MNTESQQQNDTEGITLPYQSVHLVNGEVVVLNHYFPDPKDHRREIVSKVPPLKPHSAA